MVGHVDRGADREAVARQHNVAVGIDGGEIERCLHAIGHAGKSLGAERIALCDVDDVAAGVLELESAVVDLVDRIGHVVLQAGDVGVAAVRILDHVAVRKTVCRDVDVVTGIDSVEIEQRRLHRAQRLRRVGIDAVRRQRDRRFLGELDVVFVDDDDRVGRTLGEAGHRIALDAGILDAGGNPGNRRAIDQIRRIGDEFAGGKSVVGQIDLVVAHDARNEAIDPVLRAEDLRVRRIRERARRRDGAVDMGLDIGELERDGGAIAGRAVDRADGARIGHRAGGAVREHVDVAGRRGDGGVAADRRQIRQVGIGKGDRQRHGLRVDCAGQVVRRARDGFRRDRPGRRHRHAVAGRDVGGAADIGFDVAEGLAIADCDRDLAAETAERGGDGVDLGGDLGRRLDVQGAGGVDGGVVDVDLGGGAAQDHRGVDAGEGADQVARNVVEQRRQRADETGKAGRNVGREVQIFRGGVDFGRAAADRGAVDADAGILRGEVGRPADQAVGDVGGREIDLAGLSLAERRVCLRNQRGIRSQQDTLAARIERRSVGRVGALLPDVDITGTAASERGGDVGGGGDVAEGERYGAAAVRIVRRDHVADQVAGPRIVEPGRHIALVVGRHADGCAAAVADGRGRNVGVVLVRGPLRGSGRCLQGPDRRRQGAGRAGLRGDSADINVVGNEVERSAVQIEVAGDADYAVVGRPVARQVAAIVERIVARAEQIDVEARLEVRCERHNVERVLAGPAAVIEFGDIGYVDRKASSRRREIGGFERATEALQHHIAEARIAGRRIVVE